MKRLCFLLALGVLGTGSGACQTALSRDDQLREAVFRYQIRQAEAQGTDRMVYFLDLRDGNGGHADPPSRLMARFARYGRRVKSDSHARRGPYGGHQDPVSGRPGVIFWVGAIHPKGDRAAEVEGGHHTGGLNASGNVYHLVRKGGRWSVSSVTSKWVS